ncbi:MarR family transcriptional regulator [Bacillus mycoides]|uniref:Uncharacterized protein n=1 Tax=Bacillus mycoides TaxID=1405 RepID=A0A1S9TDX8_BACMY|nr:hypothetical protein [Bacillus mycoides]OOR07791.1 hypothetical protein BW900_04570 [Bacillus mycoides]
MDNLQVAKTELLEAGYDLISPAQKESRKKYKPIERDGRHFTMQNIESYELLRSQLTQGQKGVLLLLTTAMEINKNGLLFKGKNERLTVEDVSVMIGKKNKQTFNILTELENIGAITKEQVGKKVFVNISEGFYRCGYMEKNTPVVKIFKKRLQEVASKLSHNELGFLSDILAHMHWETHILCSNPTETDASKLEVWKGKDIVEVLGYSRNFVSATLKKFRQNEITMEIGTVIDVIVLDPDLVSKQAKKVTLEDIKRVAKQVHPSSFNYRKGN